MANEKVFMGRKVFFLNAPTGFEKAVIDNLRSMEYEVYSIKDYRVLKEMIRLNPDSIVFIIPTTALNFRGWRNFIKSFENETIFAPLDVGIIMRKMNPERESLFLAGVQYDAGLIYVDNGIYDTMRKIVASLDRLNAKGIRKYVRADCKSEKSAEIYWLKDEKMLKFNMIYISSVGVAALFPARLQNDIFVNQVISSAYINMEIVQDGTGLVERNQLPIELKISAIKVVGENLLVVFMYGNETAISVIKKIREYVTYILNRNLYASIMNLPLDNIDYNVLGI